MADDGSGAQQLVHGIQTANHTAVGAGNELLMKALNNLRRRARLDRIGDQLSVPVLHVKLAPHAQNSTDTDSLVLDAGVFGIRLACCGGRALREPTPAARYLEPTSHAQEPSR